jgi:hypothetical protein
LVLWDTRTGSAVKRHEVTVSTRDEWLFRQLDSLQLGDFHQTPKKTWESTSGVVIRTVERQWMPAPGAGYVTFNWGIAIRGLAERIFGRQEPNPIAYISGRPKSVLPSLRSDIWPVESVGPAFGFVDDTPLVAVQGLLGWLPQFENLEKVHEFLVVRDPEQPPRLVSPSSETNRLELLIGVELLLGHESLKDRTEELEARYRESGQI